MARWSWWTPCPVRKEFCWSASRSRRRLRLVPWRNLSWSEVSAIPSGNTLQKGWVEFPCLLVMSISSRLSRVLPSNDAIPPERVSMVAKLEGIPFNSLGILLSLRNWAVRSLRNTLQNWKECTYDENSFQFSRILPLDHKMMWSPQEIHSRKGEYITCLLMMTLPSNPLGIFPSFSKWCYPSR